MSNAYEMPFKVITGTKASATDLSTARYKFVDIDANGELVAATADKINLGVLQQPGETGSVMDLPVMVAGVSYVTLGGVVAAGDEVSVNATGAVIKATSGAVVGKCLVGGNEGEVGSILLK